MLYYKRRIFSTSNKSITRRLSNLIKPEGTEEYVVKGIYDFEPLLSEIKNICYLTNKRYLANIGCDNKANVQILHPRTLLDSSFIPPYQKKIGWERFGYGVYLSDFPIDDEFKKFKTQDVFKSFFSVKHYNDESTYMKICGKEKRETAKLLSKILKEVFLYEDDDIAHVNLYFWSNSKEVF